MEQKEIIRKWLDGSLSDDELRDQLDPTWYDDLLMLLEKLHGFKAPEFKKEKLWKELKKRRKKQVRFTSTWLMKAAAIVITVLGLSYYFIGQDPLNSKSDPSTEREITLVDNSRVILNTFSDLDYIKNGNDRSVDLKGEAYFVVESGPGFEVNTTNMKVMVVGTTFNVIDHDDGYLEVTCYEGKVKVILEATEYHISQNESIRQINGEVTRIKTDAEHPTWIAGKSSFREVPFRYVLRDFERQYGLKVTTENIDLDRLFTGSFTHKDTLLALETITKPFDINFRKENDVIVLTRAR